MNETILTLNICPRRKWKYCFMFYGCLFIDLLCIWTENEKYYEIIHMYIGLLTAWIQWRPCIAKRPIRYLWLASWGWLCGYRQVFLVTMQTSLEERGRVIEDLGSRSWGSLGSRVRIDSSGNVLCPWARHFISLHLSRLEM